MDHIKYEFLLFNSTSELSQGSVFCGTDHGEPIEPEYVVEIIGDENLLIEGMIDCPWSIVQLDKLAASGLLRLKKLKTDI